MHQKPGSPVSVTDGSKAFAQSGDGAREVLGDQRGGAQALHRVPAVGDCSPGLFEGGIQRVPRFGPVLDHVRNGVKLQQDSLETLQECVVQVARDARALADALLQTEIELPLQRKEPRR